MQMWLWHQRSLVLLPMRTNTTRARDGYAAFAYKVSPFFFFFFLREPSHTSSTWSGASRLPRSEPRPLSSRLHFTLSVLSLCLTTRWSMLTVSLLGGERDREIKFILNSFPLMWQLPPPPSVPSPSPLLSSPSGTAWSLFQKHISFMFCTQKAFSFTPSRNSNFTAEMACLSFNLRRSMN